MNQRVGPGEQETLREEGDSSIYPGNGVGLSLLSPGLVPEWRGGCWLWCRLVSR